MMFHVSDQPTMLLAQLCHQKEQGRFCDLALYAGGKVFKAHRSVLASVSPYFDSILKTHKIIKERLTVTCNNGEIFKTFLDFIYTGNVDIHRDNVAELLRLSNHFLIPKLKAFCIEFLERSLDYSFCLFIKDLADKFDIIELTKNASIFIQINLNKILDHQEILGLNHTKLETLLSEKKMSISPLQILHTICRWVSHDAAGRESYFGPMLSLVNWQGLPGPEMVLHLDSESVYRQSEACLFLALQGLNQNSILPHKYLEILQNLSIKMEQGRLVPAQLNHHIPCNENRPMQKMTKKTVLVRRCRPKRRLTTLGPKARLAALRNAWKTRREKQAWCPWCGYRAQSVEQLEIHMASNHGRTISYKCGICGHISRAHPQHIAHMDQHFPGPNRRCDQCSFESSGLSELLTHRATQHLDKIFPCTQCGYKARSLNNLEAHSRLHSVHFKCEICGKGFANKISLDQHSLSHKPFICDMCGFSTRFLSHLVAHKRIHSGEMYRCSFTDCKKSRKPESNAPRPHSCNICGRAFLEKSHLVRHERIHLEEKPFKCSQCEYASSRRDKLKEHFARHHAYSQVDSTTPYHSGSPPNSTGSGSNTGQPNGPDPTGASNHTSANGGSGAGANGNPNGATNGGPLGGGNSTSAVAAAAAAAAAYVQFPEPPPQPPPPEFHQFQTGGHRPLFHQSYPPNVQSDYPCMSIL